MPRDPVYRLTPSFAQYVARVIRVILLAGLGGGLIGTAFMAGLSVRFVLETSAAYGFQGQRFFESAVVALAMGFAAGGVCGILSTPVAALGLLFKPLKPAFRTIYTVTCGVTLLAALVHPGLGVGVAIASLLAMSLFAMGNLPTTWPPFAPAGRCVGCGYDLAGIRARACPECGRNRPAFDECRACGSPLAGRPPGHCANCFTPYAGPSVCQSCGHAIGLDPVPACPHCTAPRLQNA